MTRIFIFDILVMPFEKRANTFSKCELIYRKKVKKSKKCLTRLLIFDILVMLLKKGRITLKNISNKRLKKSKKVLDNDSQI